MNQQLEVGARVAQETLNNLIRQFSDEMAFLRELIQNSMDASSSEVDVKTAYLEDKGVATIAVVDFGEGMTREIIDTKLTRLFASGKEDDYTKIGKFGIGFVSVFAIEPDVVVVDTGRSGESWRLLFKPGGTFERIRLAEPVEGTAVTLYKSMRRPAFEELERRARRTVSFWCRHAQVTIRFNGEPLNEPFDIEGTVKTRFGDAFTEVVAALTTESAPFYGFYNHGLTLLEGHEALIPGVTFKIKSRYLEHTLTRDNVKKDQNYDKAMKLLRRLVNEDLMKSLFDDLSAASMGRDDARYHEMLAHRGPHLASRWTGAHRHLPLVRSLHERRPYSLEELNGSSRAVEKLLGSFKTVPRARHVLFEDGPTSVTEELDRRGVAVLATRTAMALRDALGQFDIKVARAGDVLAVASAVRPAPGDTSRLLQSTSELLARCNIRLKAVEVVKLEGSPRFAQTLPIVVQRADGALVAGSSAALREDESPPRWPLSLLPRGRLLVNAEHPLIRRLSDLWPHDAGTASYALAKIACLTDGIHPELEDRLLAAHLAGNPSRATAPADERIALQADVEGCMASALPHLREDELLEAHVELEDLGPSLEIAAFKGMRVVLNAGHPYLSQARRGDGTSFRLASAIFTCFNRALDRISDDHEIAFLQALAEWMTARRVR